MSYDPRRGESAYLGMDADEYEEFEDMPDDMFESSPTSSSQPLYRSESEDTLYRTDTGAIPRQTDADDTLYRGATGARQDAQVPRTILRPAQAPRESVTRRRPDTLQGTAARSPLYRQTSSRDAMRAVPSPEQQPYDPARPSFASPRRSFGSKAWALIRAFALFMLALLLRAAAIMLAVLVVASTFLTGSSRATLISALNLTPILVPHALLGQFVMETPFGGVLRGDLVIASILLFLADWICMRFAASLRYGRERSY